jgi:hypothetical protein
VLDRGGRREPIVQATAIERRFSEAWSRPANVAGRK